MQYVGSKNRLAKELIPIIQSYINEDTKGYLEPFVGGANVIDKIKCDNKIGCDIHKELIALLQYNQNYSNTFPNTITKEEYEEVKDNKESYPDWYVGLVGFCGSYGAKYFGGYAKGNDTRDRQNEAIRNLQKQSDKIKGITFKHCDFRDLPKDKIKGYVIYCDIPYKGATGYSTSNFPYSQFYEWVKEMAVHNIVLISEYNMPDEFECIWKKDYRVNFNNNRTAGDKRNKRVEKLYTYKINKK